MKAVTKQNTYIHTEIVMRFNIKYIYIIQKSLKYINITDCIKNTK